MLCQCSLIFTEISPPHPRCWHQPRSRRCAAVSQVSPQPCPALPGSAEQLAKYKHSSAACESENSVPVPGAAAIAAIAAIATMPRAVWPLAGHSLPALHSTATLLPRGGYCHFPRGGYCLQFSHAVLGLVFLASLAIRDYQVEKRTRKWKWNNKQCNVSKLKTPHIHFSYPLESAALAVWCRGSCRPMSHGSYLQRLSGGAPLEYNYAAIYRVFIRQLM